MFDFDIFISYSHNDRELVHEWLVPHLELRGLRVAIDQHSLSSGLLSDELRRLIRSSKSMLSVITKNYTHSRWTRYEAEFVAIHDPTNMARRQIPCRFEDVEIPEFFQVLVVYDLSNPLNRETELERVLALNGFRSEPLGTSMYVELNLARNASLLKSLRIDSERLSQLFYRWAPVSADLQPQSWSVWECARKLAMCSSHEPVVGFLQEICTYSQIGDSANQLCDSIGLTPAARVVPEPICLVLIEPPKGDHSDERDAHDVSIYRWWSPNRAELAIAFSCPIAQLEDRVPEGIKLSLNDLNLQGIRARAIEVVMPFELILDENVTCVERWELVRRRRSGQKARGGTTLGARYPVALRSLDRWEDGDLWLEIQDRLGIADGVIAKLTSTGFREGEDPYTNRMVTAVIANRPLTEDELDCVIFSGVPVLVWVRQPSTESGTIDQLVRIANCSDADSLCGEVHNHRCNVDDFVAQHLAVMHDIERRQLPRESPLRNSPVMRMTTE